ncbi:MULTISPECIES: IspD/TarI family cytidylyltransferase [Streptococcus]|jgi:2-C-methyl-D-erythritol 4-phosphate cytidylyltransferase 8|uniref:IspD/TarI family cytidylyltransferase n=1 Tax=Streptococcus TaxID=1301 RepID=UPI00066A97F2|nr:IspD/TarI family cytidylyltransferase [Streptococcus pseudopneumoniae]
MKIALLTASGIGSRIKQDIPKQFIHVDNRPLIIHTLEKFQNHPNIDEICVVVLKGWEEMLKTYARQFNITKLKYIVNGGETGQLSIYNGLNEIKKKNVDRQVTVLIHDGNRPMVSNEIIDDAFSTYSRYGNAVAAIPCVEVTFVLDNESENHSISSLKRELLRRTQTPHIYNLDDILELHNRAIENGITEVAASCELMKMFGKETYFSMGSEKNLKITTLDDLEIFKALLKSKKENWIKD